MKPRSRTLKTDTLKALQAERRQVIRVMQREMICSEHGARCFIEARRRDNARARRATKAKR